MKRFADLHNHTVYSYDSSRSMIELIEEAISKKIFLLGFSDHLDFNESDPGNLYYEGKKQFEEFEMLRKKFSGKINLLLGIEASYERAYKSKIFDMFNSFRFDYRIMSAHFVEGVVISDWIDRVEKDAENLLEVDYSPYFDALELIADEGDFDILGHLDYYKKYSKFDHASTEKRYQKRYESVFRRILERRKIIEVNSSGLRHRCEEQFPSENLLLLYRDMGGRSVSTGSDSHSAGQTAYGFDLIYSMAERAGLNIFKIEGEEK